MPATESATSFWSALDPRDAAELATTGIVRTFPAGRSVIYQNQVPDRVLILRAGWVKVLVTTPSGRDAVLAFRGPGDLVGELAALDDQPRGATVSVVQRVEALSIPSHAFRTFVEAHASVAVVLLRHLSRRLREADAKRIEFLEYTTIERVAARLIEFARLFGEEDGDVVRLPVTQDELAGATYASLESVGRALKDMRGLNYVETRRREIRILDRSSVERLCRGR